MVLLSGVAVWLTGLFFRLPLLGKIFGRAPLRMETGGSSFGGNMV
jgi:hypothetical protein